jgi:phosphoesterase family protein
MKRPRPAGRSSLPVPTLIFASIFVASGVGPSLGGSGGGLGPFGATPVSPTVLSHTSFDLVGSASGVSPSFVSTRADTLLIAVAEHSNASVRSVKDGLGNTIKQLGPSMLYKDANGAQRLTLFAGFNLTRGGADNVSVSLSLYVWAVVLIADVTNVGATPLDAQSASTNSSQMGLNTSVIQNSVPANASDLVLMFGAIRGPAYENATGGDLLVETNESVSSFNEERAASFSQTQGGASGKLTLKATNSNRWAPWLAEAIALRPGVPWCGFGCPVASVSIRSHLGFGFATGFGTSPSFGAHAGDTVLVFVNVGNVSARPTTVRDSAGDSFQLLSYGNFTQCCGSGLAVWYAKNVAGRTAETLNVSMTSAAPSVVLIAVVLGADAVSPIAVESPLSGSSGSTVAQSTMANATDLILMDLAASGNLTAAAVNDTLLDRAGAATSNSGETGADFSRNASSAHIPVALQAGLSSPAAWLAVSVALRPSPVGGSLVAPPPTAAVVAAHVSFSIVGQASGTSPPFPAIRGHSLFVFIGEHSSATVSSVKDRFGNPFIAVGPGGFYSDANGAERVSIYASNNLRLPGTDNLTVTTSASAWSVVIVVDVSGAAPQPVDAQAPFSNSSQTNQSAGTIRSSLLANASDLVLMVGGIRGTALENATGGDTLVDSNASNAQFNGERAAVFQLTQGSASTTVVAQATNSNRFAPWVAGAVAILSAAALKHDIQHVVTILLENHANYQVMGGAHYQAYLEGRYGTVGAMYSICHPSLTFYLGVEAGSAFGLCTNLVQDALSVNASDLVLMVAGLRGAGYLNATGGDTLLDSNVSKATYNTETAAVFEEAQGNASGVVDIEAHNSNPYAAWVADTIALRGAAGTPTVASHVSWSIVGKSSGTSPPLRDGRGDTLLVFVAEHSNATVTSVTDSQGDHFIALGPSGYFYDSAGPERVGLYAALNVSRSGSDNVTITTSGYAWTVGIAVDVSGLATPPIDGQAPFVNSSSHAQSGNPVIASSNLADLLESQGFSWMSYLEAMPSACATTDSGPYVTRHNPFIHFSDVVGNATRCKAHVLNSRYFNQSVVNGTLANYSFYAPSVYDDCESTPLATCDTWLQNFLSPILNATRPAERAVVNHTVFFIVYDESLNNDTSGYSGMTGGRVYFVAIDPWSIGTHSAGNASAFNILETVEWLFDLGNTGHDDSLPSFPPLTALFSFPSNQY